MTWFRGGLTAWVLRTAALLFSAGRRAVAEQQPSVQRQAAAYVGSAACARCRADLRPVETDAHDLEEHKLGETTFTHFADGIAHKTRMQGNDFVQSVMYTHG